MLTAHQRQCKVNLHLQNNHPAFDLWCQDGHGWIATPARLTWMTLLLEFLESVLTNTLKKGEVR